MRNTIAPPARQPEPPLIERARRTGWALLALCVIALVIARAGPDAWQRVALGGAIAFGLLGLLAIVNVALVRGLYRQLDTARVEPGDPPDHSM